MPLANELKQEVKLLMEKEKKLLLYRLKQTNDISIQFVQFDDLNKLEYDENMEQYTKVYILID